MGRELLILTGDTPSRSDQAMGDLAELLGLRATYWAQQRGDADLSIPLFQAGVLLDAIACSGAVLEGVVGQSWFEAVLSRTRFFYIYDLTTSKGSEAALKWITAGAVTGTHHAISGNLELSADTSASSDHAPVFSQRWTSAPANMVTFGACAPAARVWMRANSEPILIEVDRGDTHVIAFSGGPVPSLDTLLTSEDEVRQWYPQLIAAVLFLRAAFGPYCWTNPNITATLIIDDPYLRHRYGFVRFEELTRKLVETRSAVTVGFIPYNYRRTAPATAALLKHHRQYLSIAVHGCDHTGGEFGSQDSAWLAATVKCARDRMNHHRAATGIDYDNVMIFPQGVFSTPALSALSASGFDCAVNSTPFPNDASGSRLPLRQFLDVAVTAYDLPLFTRRYVREPIDFAFDALLQKPLLAVDHHTLFTDGLDRFVNVVETLNGVSPKPAWMPLGQALATCQVQRKVDDATWATKHFSSRLHIQNPADREVTWLLEKPDPAYQAAAVTIGGVPASLQFDAAAVRYSVRLKPGAMVDVSVRYRTQPVRTRHVSARYRMSVALRRLACDLRDNYVARSPMLLAAAEHLRANLTAARRGQKRGVTAVNA